MSYLDLVEEYPREPELTQFEKILVAARRAKDLHNSDKIPMADNHITSGYLALQELRDGKILRTYQQDEPTLEIAADDSDDDEEDDD